MVTCKTLARSEPRVFNRLRQLPEDVVGLARHIEARVLGDDPADVKHAMMLDHFVEKTS